MPRLFVSDRDIAYINDTAKEFVKDVVGQKIIYYAISTMATQTHRFYDESSKKVFESPIALDVIVGQPENKSSDNKFGFEQTTKFEVFVQARDLIDKRIMPSEGDYFTYAGTTFEVVSFLNMNNIFGMAEYENAYKFVGKQVRPGEFDPPPYLPPGSVADKELGEVQTTFVQQRGLPETSQGTTGDRRQVRELLGDEMAEPALGEGPREVSPDATGKVSKFRYD